MDCCFYSGYGIYNPLKKIASKFLSNSAKCINPTIDPNNTFTLRTVYEKIHRYICSTLALVG